MTPGVSYPSCRDGATWTGSGWASGWPVTNVADCVYLSNVARAAAAGSQNINFVLPASQQVQFVALANHNLAAGDLIRLRLYSDAAFSTQVADTGVMLAWPGGSAPVLKPDGKSRFRSTRPILLGFAVGVQSGRIDITTSATIAEVGGVEISGWWPWSGISQSRETGIDSRETSNPFVGGGESVPREFSARQINGQIDYIALGPTGTDIALDFQRQMDLDRPFCFVNDTSDPTTWARLALMVTNTQLPPLTGALYRSDRFAFRFNEALR